MLTLTCLQHCQGNAEVRIIVCVCPVGETTTEKKSPLSKVVPALNICFEEGQEVSVLLAQGLTSFRHFNTQNHRQPERVTALFELCLFIPNDHKPGCKKALPSEI